MKKILFLFLAVIGCGLHAQQPFSSGMNKEDITKVCNAVAEWQINHQSEVRHHPLDWTNGALYRGMQNGVRFQEISLATILYGLSVKNIIGICGTEYIMQMISA